MGKQTFLLFSSFCQRASTVPADCSSTVCLSSLLHWHCPICLNSSSLLTLGFLFLLCWTRQFLLQPILSCLPCPLLLWLLLCTQWHIILQGICPDCIYSINVMEIQTVQMNRMMRQTHFSPSLSLLPSPRSKTRYCSDYSTAFSQTSPPSSVITTVEWGPPVVQGRSPRPPAAVLL